MITTVHNALIAAAAAIEVPQERVVLISAADNLTIPRPRIEYQLLPEHYKRSGKVRGATRSGSRMDVKRELYEVTLGVNINLLADDADWLGNKSPLFIAALPPGINDSRGNYVKIRVQEAHLQQPPAKRVGLSEIKVFTRINRLYLAHFIWRVTAVEEKELIETITFNHPEIGEKK